MLHRVINRCLDGLSWDISFFVNFVTSDFSTTDTTRDTYLDSFCTLFHSLRDSLFDNTTVWETTLDLTTDAITDECRMNIRVFDFFDIDMYFLSIESYELLLEFCEILTILTEDKSCTRSVDNNTETSIAMGDSDVTNWETFEKFSNEVTDSNILPDSGCVFCFIVVSCRCPRAGNSDTP